MKRMRLAATGGTLLGLGILTTYVAGQAPAAVRSAAPPAGQPPYLAGASPRFTTLPGFTVERVVPDGRTDSYVVLTFDSLGRPVVSKEQDHPRILLDADGDGVFESEKVISDRVRNCQGLWFDGRTLYGNCAPSDPAAPQEAGGGRGGAASRSGLFRMPDDNGDDVADGVEQLAEYQGGIQEHGAHAIRRGPDGAPVVMVGNNSFVPDAQIDPAAIFRHQHESQFLPALPDGRGFGPSVKEGMHGVLSRYDAATRTFSPIFGGLRNAYDVAFNLAGEAFTFDSDMEWDINMPWYREVRTVHGVPGGNYGYRNGSGKLPDYYIDSLPPVRDLRRGSPVGVEVYQHTAYPAEYADSLLEADWSRGRLLWTPLIRDGATYRARETDTQFVHGEPLNITDVEVGPDGLVYFTTGGRTTQGGLYRVRYTGPAAAPAGEGLLAITRQPQPLSSWGWAAIERARTSLGDAFASGLIGIALDTAADSRDRSQAIYLLQRHGSPPATDVLTSLMRDRDAAVRAAAVYVAGVQGRGAVDVARAGLRDADSMVRRRAAEAMLKMGLSSAPDLASVDDVYPLLQSSDRFVRWAGRHALEQLPLASWRDRALGDGAPLAGIEALVALVEASPADAPQVLARAADLIRKGGMTRFNEVRLLRAFQLAAIATPDVPAGLREGLFTALAAQFPTGDRPLDRELALTMAWTDQPGAVAELLQAMPQGDADQPLQIHDVYALRTIRAGWTPELRAELTAWFGKALTWRGGASFPGFLNLLFDEAVKTAGYTAAEQQAALAALPQFAPLTAGEASAGRGGRPAPSAAARGRGARTLSRDELFDELIYTPQRSVPSAEAGRQVFVEMCAACHRHGDLGRDLGPDLTTVSSRFKRRDLVEALLWPSRVISDQYASTLIETRDGTIVSGMTVSEDAQKVVLRTPADPERPVAVAKERIARREASPVSLMPDGLADAMTNQQIQNLLAFLQADADRP